MAAVDLKECINIIERGEWFSIRFLTGDVSKGTGGRVIEIPKARIARKQSPGNVASVQQQNNIYTDAPKNPNHAANFTRNLELPNHKLRKVHPILITHINNQAVV